MVGQGQRVSTEGATARGVGRTVLGAAGSL